MIEINSTYRLQTEGNCIFSGSGVRLIEFQYAPPPESIDVTSKISLIYVLMGRAIRR